MNLNIGEVLVFVSILLYNLNDFVFGMDNDKWNSLNSDLN